MTTWTSKDPQAVQDYTYTIPLAEGDSVASATFTKLSGDVVIDNDPEAERVDDLITVWLSGGTEGETNVFRVAWVTADGREEDDGISLAILSNEFEPLELTGYAKPNVQHLIMRYPAFADVEPTTIAYWLTDAERYVDTTWSETDYAVALMAMAAHQMSARGLGTTSAAIASLPAGVSSFKSAELSVTLSSAAADGRATGALSSTIYGAEFIGLRRRNHAGPRVALPGTAPVDPRVYPMGET
jgi:hypothetical protein